MVCPIDQEIYHPTLYVILWDNDTVTSIITRERIGGVLRLCWEHMDELNILISEAL